ncbi:putative ABC transporter substrate-binding lipoprotein YvgL [Jeotgalicoccus coquinae]|uniref:Molybdate transport system substrate-binding protein n=1 Tax=Jeotgalicoccus coquinae TaxID=709509 RepID=A0A6V7R1Z7_9STAP|nr:molybdate ABC transporter substrate-binding protein [Jeotgalicoccus coquinae]MBB6423695.1 molybdate transport system substrate-binding protein [Jeotgalicoccus coquinae]GGE21897.1 putative ABC transporter substrate-binding lipoprotein YvgL [Jeotgalicoccus coquinae]CAD2071064.1 Molybdate-binding periplasmic protein precursor [Jeotgalicoccus coquinae]
MIRKNVLGWALLLSLCVILAACSNNDESSDNESEPDETKETEETTEDETEDASDEAEESTEEVPAAEEGDIVHITAEQSLEHVMDELITLFEENNEDIKIDVQYGHTETLTEDLIEGNDKDMDIYFSSDDEGYDSLVEAGILNQLATKYLLINELVLVTGSDNEDIATYNDIFNNEDVSLTIVDPEHSLSGTKAEELLVHEEERNMNPDNVKTVEDTEAALKDIAANSTDAGFLLRTDISTDDDVRIISRAPRSITKPLVYGLGLSNGVDDGSAADTFYNYLQSEEALEIFTNYGYIV